VEARRAASASASRFDWDDGNVDKLAERGVRPEEVEGIWANRPRYLRNKRTGSATWMMVGTDPRSGKRLRIGILWVDEEEGVLRAIHALELKRGRQR
jgi:hypothetical protein